MNPRAQENGDIGSRPESTTGTGDIEERLIERERFDQRRHVTENSHDHGAHLGVAPMAARQEHCVRAQPTCHRR